LREALGFQLQPLSQGGVLPPSDRLSSPAISAAAVMLIALFPALALPQRAEIRPARTDFTRFPVRLGGWVGSRERIDQIYLDELKVDDYLMDDFAWTQTPNSSVVSGASVNLYVAYYAVQRPYQTVHSPRSCLPGGGWRIEQLDQRQVPGLRLGSGPLRINRALIQQGNQRELVYYWFQERGRDITSEYLGKWYLLVDAVSRNRTDGALVRLITPLRDGEDPRLGDARLTQFGAAAVPTLARYLPD
jgi:EpsI family protein